MTIELPPPTSRTLSRILKSGVYSSPAEAVTDGLRLLQELMAGISQVKARRVSPFDEAAATRVKARGRKLLSAERRAKRSTGR
jgi:Arc/MetJ-type ribon-helix-helix transcriptional regulator